MERGVGKIVIPDEWNFRRFPNQNRMQLDPAENLESDTNAFIEMLSNSKDRTFSLLLRLKPVLTVSLLQGRNAQNLVTIWELFLLHTFGYKANGAGNKFLYLSSFNENAHPKLAGFKMRTSFR
ncbi:hypothetical protein VNO78_39894 [Psophocarpus tetragonolobus]|uniref:Uncharacterized protein n=1 Tax=Psophocarpus tetragonolobus TaxID=3891 RepID=A0AAN9N8N2_PSOTE